MKTNCTDLRFEEKTSLGGFTWTREPSIRGVSDPVLIMNPIRVNLERAVGTTEYTEHTERDLNLKGFYFLRHPRIPWFTTAFSGIRGLGTAAVVGLVVSLILGTQGIGLARAAEPAAVQILKIQGPANSVEVLRAEATVWDPARDNQPLYPGDRLRTLENGRVTLRWSDNSTVRLPQFSDLLVEPTPGSRQLGLNLLKGLLFFFHRDQPTEARFGTRTASAAIRGTEFVLEFQEPEGRTILSVLDGQVELSNTNHQSTHLVSGEQGLVMPGNPPRKTAIITAVNLVQWCLYYPGVLDVDELELGAGESQALADSIGAYRQGDLLGALAKYPAGRLPATAEEKVYRAAVLLAAGRVDATEPLLQTLPASGSAANRTLRLANALRKVIAAVRLQTPPSTLDPQASPLLATEWLAESYFEQSRSKLRAALEAAERAVKQAPGFGLGQARVAELQFCFGYTRQALASLEKALALSPRNAQAVALQGFLLAAQNRIPAALARFNQTIELDGGLGNAWLGRGLCQIRQGRISEGKDDLQVAVTVEPQRALLRSYLAKAFSAAGNDTQARRELERAKDEDPNDPTAWLYSALLAQQENRINDAVGDLEKSQELNQNRSVYRSNLELDQDRAVRQANQASVYRDAGMFDVAVREAGRAVNTDPANYSAHLFLANAYYEMLDPHQYNQRYESARVNEYLTATLLAPVGAGPLSQAVSSQEYARFFERDGLGVFSSTEYLSRGAWQQSAAQYGRCGDLAYSLDGYYRNDPGQRANNDLEQYYTSLQLKLQPTPADSVYVQTVLTQSRFGDLGQVYDPSSEGNRQVRNQETQEPLLLAGYHHEWSPGNHTLCLVGRFQDTLSVNDPAQQTLVLSHLDSGFNYTPAITGVSALSTPQDYRSEANLYSFEAQQILQRERYALIGGGRYQGGEFQTKDTLTLPAGSPMDPGWFANPPQDCSTRFERWNLYGYAHWQAADPLRLIAGLSYDWLRYPQDFRFAPITDRAETKDLVSPKAGFIWTPFQASTVRAAYSRSLGGVSLDQSFQLEPSQVAGFNQAWRSLIPESVAGANAAAEFENWNVSLEQRLPTRTYLGLGGEILNSRVNRWIGAFAITEPQFGVFPMPPFIVQSGTDQQLKFQERSLTLTVNQLVGEGFSLGARYRFSQAELRSLFPDVPATAVLQNGFTREYDQTANLHQLSLSTLYNHRSGLFAEAQALWNRQDNDGYSPSLPGDNFWQFNLYAGYRFLRRQAEVRLGLLNLAGQDYRLNPLNLTAELPRDRTLVVSARFSF